MDSGDRLEHLKTCKIGDLVEVHLHNGSVYSGRFQDVSGIILEEACLIKKEGESVRAAPIETVTILADEIVQVINKENEPQNRIYVPKDFDKTLSKAKRFFSALKSRDVDFRTTEMGEQSMSTERENNRDLHASKDDYQNAQKNTHVEDSCPTYIAIPAHSYGPDSFHLYGLPSPRLGEIVALVGATRIGKTTALDVLSGDLKPNLCETENPPDWPEILKQFCRTDIHGYLTRIKDKNLKVSRKVQDIDDDGRMGSIKLLLSLHRKNEPYRVMDMINALDLPDSALSGRPQDLTKAELQKLVIAVAVLRKADSYIFDEPSSFLNMRDKSRVAKVMRSVIRPNRYVIIADQDVDLMKYVSDHICHVGGTPGVFGEIKAPQANIE